MIGALLAGGSATYCSWGIGAFIVSRSFCSLVDEFQDGSGVDAGSGDGVPMALKV
jgi:hypothetical protein